jgi:hypothetical protein
MILGSEIRDPEKTYSGSRIQGSKGHRILDPDPQHCFHLPSSVPKRCGEKLMYPDVGNFEDKMLIKHDRNCSFSRLNS